MAVVGDLAVQVLDEIVAVPVVTLVMVVVVVRHILAVCKLFRYGEVTLAFQWTFVQTRNYWMFPY